jgi:hypothetical protein
VIFGCPIFPLLFYLDAIFEPIQMTLLDRIVELAKEYEVDFHFVNNQDSNADMEPVSRELFNNLNSNILAAIWEDQKGASIADSFLFYAQLHIKDNKRFRPLVYSLLTIVENEIVEARKLIDREKQTLKEIRAKDRDDLRISLKDTQIRHLERYQTSLLGSRAAILMEIDNLKLQPQGIKRSTGQPRPKPTNGLQWIGPKNPILINELFKNLRTNCLDSKTIFSDFDKIFQGKSLPENFRPINWIHTGGAYSLCFWLFLITKERPVFTCVNLHKFISEAFIVNGQPVNRASLKSYFSRIKAGEYPTYYTELRIQFNQVLRSAKI